MSDIERLEQKIDQHIDNQVRSNDKLEAALEKISDSMVTFVGFQTRAEERHSNMNQRLEKLETQAITRFEKLEDRVDKLWDMVHKNSLVVNGIVAVVTAVSIWIIKGFFNG